MEHSLQPGCEPCPRGRRRCRRTSRERIATAECPQLAADHSRARHVDPRRQIRSLRPRVRSNIVIIQRVQVGVIKVASTSYVDVPVDNAKAGSSHRDRHARSRCVPGVGYRVILPYLAKRWIHISGRISAYQIDLAVLVA